MVESGTGCDWPTHNNCVLVLPTNRPCVTRPSDTSELVMQKCWEPESLCHSDLTCTSQLHCRSCLWRPSLTGKSSATNGSPWKGTTPAWLSGWLTTAAVRKKHPLPVKGLNWIWNQQDTITWVPKILFLQYFEDFEGKKQASHMAGGICWVRLPVSAALGGYRRQGSKAEKSGGLDPWIQSSQALGTLCKLVCIGT